MHFIFFEKPLNIIIGLRNLIVRLIMLFPSSWWFVLNFFNNHFMCSVIGIVRDENNKILLFDHKYRPDPIAYPAGWLKKGEDPLTAIAREIKEETNFIVEPIRILSVGSSKKNAHLEFVVEAKFVGGEFRASDEIKDYSWVEASALSSTFETFNCDISETGALKEENYTSNYSIIWE
ncbi:MAG: NUDIX hydrolase [Ignavibacteriaceae bacterium]